MNFTVHNITLDLHKTGSQVFLPMYCGDSNRKIVIHLTEDGRPYRLPLGLRAHFTGAKPDGTYLYNECEVDEQNNTVDYVVTKQTTAAEGMVCCQLRLVGSDGGTISTPSFTIVANSTVYNDEQITESSSEFLALTKLYTEIQNKFDSGEFDGKDGTSVTHSFDGTVLKMTSASGTTEVDLKGDKGDIGPQGSQGIQGDKGETGAAGQDGADGQDGISASHSWNGTILTITSASGTSSADLKGEKGEKGDKGDAFTYDDLTDEQKAELKEGIEQCAADQTYNPDSENAQSGKAVAEAASERIPKPRAYGAPVPRLLMLEANVESETSDGMMPDSAFVLTALDDGNYNYKTSVGDSAGMVVARDGKGNLWTGEPVDNEDCINRIYANQNYVGKMPYDDDVNPHIYATPNHLIGDRVDGYMLHIDDGGALAGDFKQFGERVARRYKNGNLLSGTPKTKHEVANKMYVDEAIEAEAVSKRIPKPVAWHAPVPRLLMLKAHVEAETSDGMMPDSAFEFKPLDDGSYTDKSFVREGSSMIPTRDSRGNLWTGTPVDDADCATKKYVDDAVSNLSGLKIVVVSTLPSTGDADTLYFVPSTLESDQNLYDEYIYTNGAWEKIGSTAVEVDLSGYMKKPASVAKEFIVTIKPDGSTDVLNYGSDAKSLLVARRDTNGCLKVGTPTDNEHATNKAYVDTLVGDIETSLSVIAELLGGI